LTKKRAIIIVDVNINNLSSYFRKVRMIIESKKNKFSLSITFSGSYGLMQYILSKYSIYNQSTKGRNNKSCNSFLKKNQYSTDHELWRNGVSYKLWNSLYKDLLILKLTNKIEFESLESLKKEYLVMNKVKTVKP
jgi:hypothetical protein